MDGLSPAAALSQHEQHMLGSQPASTLVSPHSTRTQPNDVCQKAHNPKAGCWRAVSPVHKLGEPLTRRKRPRDATISMAIETSGDLGPAGVKSELGLGADGAAAVTAAAAKAAAAALADMPGADLPPVTAPPGRCVPAQTHLC